jgi:hypothetical protein
MFEHLVSNYSIPVVLERNLGPRCLMLIAFYRTDDEGVREIRTSPNLLHFLFPRWETHIERKSYRQTDVCQILFLNKNQN